MHPVNSSMSRVLVGRFCFGFIWQDFPTSVHTHLSVIGAVGNGVYTKANNFSLELVSLAYTAVHSDKVGLNLCVPVL